ncbi:MinD/ParA family ATP-binding protein [Salinibaculum salinum]|uniref:MinD/ParA family ATP-binding protein n=1 Tax=Salinibaculum salinum TaxID=3131996 RepID=UPI0030EBC65C
MFAITGGKGGCGKTTMTLGIARALAAQGADPLVVDADVDMPDLHLLADVPPEPNADDLAAGAHLDCCRHRSAEYSGIAVVPAGRAETTATALRRLEAWHGPVLVDCPAGASEDATLPLRMADATVLVTTDTPQSLSDAKKTARIAARLDAPVSATVIRGPDADTVPAPVDTAATERLDDSSANVVLSDPSFLLACSSIANLIRSNTRQEEKDRCENRPKIDRTGVSSGGSRIENKNGAGIFNGR